MTVSTTTTYNEATGAGGVSTFYFTFRCDDGSWVKVYLDGVLQGSGYWVSLNVDQDANPGGAVTIAPAPDGKVVLIQRETPLTQLTNYTAYDAFPAESHEMALDKITLEMQEVGRDVDAIATAEAAARIAGDAASAALVTAEAASRLSGDQAEAAVRAAADAAIIASGSAPANVGIAPVTSAATGATTPQTVAAHLGATINLKDAGCVCNGVSDDSAALSALVTALGTTAKTIVVSGDCHVHSNVTLPWRCPVRFEGGGKFSGTGVVTYSSVTTVPNTYSAARNPMVSRLYGDPASLNDIYSMAYNTNPETATRYSTDHPMWSENFEARYVAGAPPGGLLERHWNYTSIDGGTIFRPFNFQVDLNNHRASMVWKIYEMEFYSRAGTNPVMRIRTDDVSGAGEGVVIQAPTSSVPLQVVGGPGNIYFQLNADSAIFGSCIQVSSAGTPTMNGVQFYSQGKYWTGAADVAATCSFGTYVTGNADFQARIYAGGSFFQFKNDGFMQLEVGQGFRMNAPNGSWWKVTMGNGGVLSIVAD